MTNTSDQSSTGMNNEQNESEKPKLASLAQLFSFCPTVSCRYRIIGAFACAFIGGAAVPAMIFYLTKAMENLSASTENQDFMATLREVSFSIMVLGAISFLSTVTQSTLIEMAATEMTQNLKTCWFRALLRQDMAYYDIQDVAGQATIISSNGEKYRKGVGRKLSESVQFIVSFVGLFAYAFYASWKTSLVVLAVAPFSFLSVLFLVKMTSTQSIRVNTSYAKAGSIVSTCVSSIRTILSLNAVPKMIASYQQATEEAYQGAVSTSWLVGLANGCQRGSFLLTHMVVTLFGGWLLYDNVRDHGCDPSNTVPDNLEGECDPTGADVFGALLGIAFGAGVLTNISVAIEAVSGARAACVPVLAAMSRTVEQDEERQNAHDTSTTVVRRGAVTPLPQYVIDSSSESGKRLESVVGEICFDNVTFSYPTRQENKVFAKLSLRIKPGRTVAIVGPSGQGKSTAIQLIERFYDPQEGKVTLDGTDLRELNVKWLRQQIGLVSQEPKLFNKSIRDNIAMGCPGVTQEQIEEAALMANAHDFIISFPNKYDTQVGELGAQLSGGQKQRIAIARVLVRNVRIFLFDEATSNLDSESERVVQRALDQLMKLSNMTTIVIAHRLSTIKDADMIVVLKDGRVTETGTHEELLQLEDQYYRLVQTQKLDDETSKSRMETSTQLRSSSSSSGLDPDERENAAASIESSIHGSDQALIRFRDVHFRYPSRPDIEVFRGLNLTVHLGETLAIVGPSGQGKSTIIQLIERFYDPYSGAVEYLGADVKSLSVRWLRDQMGLVSQEPVLFDTSIEENIRYGLDSATQKDIQDAARMANAHDFINKFPEGYKTSVGQGSTLISGGQKQRIALARALLKKPKLLLLDEATSELDSESEKVVQATLDEIMFGSNQLTCVTVAHRLSTIRNADRIAIVDRGKVREVGTHDELMALGGKYAKLVSLQNLGVQEKGVDREYEAEQKRDETAGEEIPQEDMGYEEEEEIEVDRAEEKSHAKRVRLLASGDHYYILVGAIGAVLAGATFPGMGFFLAFMIELLYTKVSFCDEENPIEPFPECDAYWQHEADEMQDFSFRISYGMLGIIVAALIGNVWLFWGFATATERMNKRVRDSAFSSLLRQEVAWFDVRSPGMISSQLADDAALLQAFVGEPVRTLVLNVASVVVGFAVSLYFMWPFALLTLGIIPFMSFGAEMETKMYLGEDKGDRGQEESSPGGLAIETLSNIRTVASLTLEDERAAEYKRALAEEEFDSTWKNLVKGSASGIGQIMQMWGMALMFWWGGWLLFNFPEDFSYRDYLISMWAIFLSMYGLVLAAQGAVNREKAKLAAHRMFKLVDRKSIIDPLSDEGMNEEV